MKRRGRSVTKTRKKEKRPASQLAPIRRRGFHALAEGLPGILCVNNYGFLSIHRFRSKWEFSRASQHYCHAPGERDMGWVQSGSHVYWTKTNGQSWSEITPAISNTQEIQSVFFLDENHGWIALDDLSDVASSPFNIASTTNGERAGSMRPPIFPAALCCPD